MKKITLLVAAALSLSVSSAFAADYTWDGGDGNWSDSAWNTGQAWVGGADANAAINAGNVLVTEDVTAGGVTLSNATLTLDSGKKLTAGSITLGPGGNLIFRGNSTNTVLAADINLNGGSIGMTYGNDAQMTGTFTGSGNLKLDNGSNQWSNVLTVDRSISAPTEEEPNKKIYQELNNTYTGDTYLTNNSLTFKGYSATNFNPFGIGVGKTVYVTASKSGNDGNVRLTFDPGVGHGGATYTISKNFEFNATNGGRTTVFNVDGKLVLGDADSTIKISTDANADSAVIFKTLYNGKDITLAGKVTGSGNVVVTDDHVKSIYYGEGALRLSNNANDFTGTYTINNSGGAKGILSVDAENAVRDANLVLESGRLRIGATNVNISQINGDENSAIYAATDNASEATVSFTGAGDSTFAGVIGYDVTNLEDTNAAKANNLAVTQSGSGTLTLSGTNTYTGATTVTGGTLAITGAGSINSSSGVTVSGGTLVVSSSVALSTALTVETGGTLQLGDGTAGSTGTVTGIDALLEGTVTGSGTVTGNGFEVSGTIAPGTSAGLGTLTLGSSGETVSFTDTAKIIINVTDASNVDMLIAGGELVLDNVTVELVFAPGYVPAVDTELTLFGGNVFFDSTEAQDAAAANITSNYGGSFEWLEDGNGNITGIKIMAIPEPSTYALFGAGVLAGLALVRRRKRA